MEKGPTISRPIIVSGFTTGLKVRVKLIDKESERRVVEVVVRRRVSVEMY